MAIVFTQAQAFALRDWSYTAGDPTRTLQPRLLTDGRYALPEYLVSDPAFQSKVAALRAGTIMSLSEADYVADTRLGIIVNGQGHFLALDRKPWTFTVVAANVHRFELRQGDQGYDESSPERLHRAEIIAADVPNHGTELWQAYSLKLGAGPAFTVDGQCYANQWHGYDADVGYSRAPPLSFDYGNDMFRIWSRSDADIDPDTLWGVSVLQYQAASPTRDVYSNIVINVKFASSGFLRVWINGVQVVNYTGPIGYYLDAHGAYPQWGIYARQAPNCPVMTYANMEHGTADLTDRILNPLPIAS